MDIALKTKESVAYTNKNPIKVRVRFIIVEDEKILLVHNIRDGFHYLPGGKVAYGESISEAANSEAKEEFLDEHTFSMEKIIYIADFIAPEREEHSVEIFAKCNLSDINSIVGKSDPEHDFSDKYLLYDINNLPKDFKPQMLLKILSEDYAKGFSENVKYLGKVV